MLNPDATVLPRYLELAHRESSAPILLTGCTEDARFDRMASSDPSSCSEDTEVSRRCCASPPTGLSTGVGKESRILESESLGEGIVDQVTRCRSSQDAYCWSDDVTGTGLGSNGREIPPL